MADGVNWERRGRALFARPCSFIRPVSDVAHLPASRLPEFAFVGRSNVGKSSLINALTSRKSLARVSNTPGRTREINLFDLGGEVVLADLPGYGFARVSKSVSAAWRSLIAAYLSGRTQLRRVCLLVDARHGIMEGDREMMSMLDASAVSYLVVLTKIDKLAQGLRAEAVKVAAAAVEANPAAFPEVLGTSAETGEGLDALRAHLARVTQE